MAILQRWTLQAIDNNGNIFDFPGNSASFKFKVEITG